MKKYKKDFNQIIAFLEKQYENGFFYIKKEEIYFDKNKNILTVTLNEGQTPYLKTSDSIFNNTDFMFSCNQLAYIIMYLYYLNNIDSRPPENIATVQDFAVNFFEKFVIFSQSFKFKNHLIKHKNLNKLTAKLESTKVDSMGRKWFKGDFFTVDNIYSAKYIGVLLPYNAHN